MNKEDERRLALIEQVRPDILVEKIPRAIYISDTKFLIRLIRQLEEQLEDRLEDYRYD